MNNNQSVHSDVTSEPDSKKCRLEDSDLKSTGTESIKGEDSKENVSETETDHDTSSDEGESRSDLKTMAHTQTG